MSNKIAGSETFRHEPSPAPFPAHARGGTDGTYKRLCTEGAKNMSWVPFLFRPVFFRQVKKMGQVQTIKFLIK